MGNVFYSVKSKIRYSSLGKSIVDSIICTNASDFIYKIFDVLRLTDGSREGINPDVNIIEEMKKSEKFFSENALRIENIYNNLEDDLSKEVFMKAIRYRQTLDIKDRPPYTIHNQYFVKDIVKINDDEVFVDCGAYMGDTINRFIREANNNYKRIIAFEPDDESRNKINPKIQDCIKINAGVWNETTTLKFKKNNNTGNSKIVQTTTIVDNNNDSLTEEINVQSIDETESCSDCTFVKMDIEGSEINALLGAQNTIRKMRPKLAICIYHSDEDMLRIPEWILGLNLNYELYIRQHLGSRLETVAYAIPK